MNHSAPRLERDVEQLQRDFRQLSDVAVRAAADIAAHKDGCVEASERVQEKIEDTREAVRAVDSKIGELKTALEREREREMAARTARQVEIDGLLAARHTTIDKEIRSIRAGNFRIVVAIIVSGISIAGALIGRALLL